MHEGNLVNGRGRDNARAEGECIIRPRPLTRLPECTKARNALQNWYLNYLVQLTDPRQPLIFEKCALSKVCIKRFNAPSCDRFWGVWFVEGHVSSTSITYSSCRPFPLVFSRLPDPSAEKWRVWEPQYNQVDIDPVIRQEVSSGYWSGRK